MRLEALFVDWFCQGIGVLQSGCDIVDLDDPLVEGVSRDVMLKVDMTRAPAAEPAHAHLDDSFMSFVSCDFVIREK